jgi:protein tyrosine/serine phosphatase
MPSRLRLSCAVTIALLGAVWAFFANFETLAAALPAPANCVDVHAGPRQSNAQPRGVANFGQVTPALFRGGQPTSEGLRELKQMGVTVVVSFRREKGENTQERRDVEVLGMRFVSLPWNAFDTPTDDEVRKFFGLLRDNPNTKVFVHCQQGRDRAGLMVALYRVAVDHWCPDSAVAEMYAYHYHHFFFPHLETYVRHFPDRIAADSGLAGGAPSSIAP